MKKIQNTVYVIKKHGRSTKVGEYKSKQSDIKIYPRVIFLVETTEVGHFSSRENKYYMFTCIQCKEEYKHWLQIKTFYCLAYKRNCKIKSVIFRIKICRRSVGSLNVNHTKQNLHSVFYQSYRKLHRRSIYQ